MIQLPLAFLVYLRTISPNTLSFEGIYLVLPFLMNYQFTNRPSEIDSIEAILVVLVLL